MSQQPFVQPGEPLNDFLRNFWQRQVDAAEQETPDYRHPPLPLARIKKVMKSDPDVKRSLTNHRPPLDDCCRRQVFTSLQNIKLIPYSTTAPILFCKACEIFISEITARAFIIADSNKRRTLSRSDIAKALSKSDQFDFLIDIVPREEMSFHGASSAKKPSNLVTRPLDDPRHSPSVLTDGQSPLDLGDDGSNHSRGGTSQNIVEQLESLLAQGPAPAHSILHQTSATPTPPIDHHVQQHPHP
ncbi:nuclear transcription factor Y [Coprinopsis cinerea okayama7|uniref:Nuclear transcription factor Y n=1 Tax=Coprinopsis cinerea (strain Okayama-7 / 130 / ATCC MYA-4618 / FGSC 9003) TaxID=240176 RepID=A8P821_COPC7|nr:nuclear transcription factor Y [Coprinopsis cinerea okayama7\|eukprot:XP_001839482.2 nuclear transcription factor Y [Coprinopsis cinerea okayama7\